MRVLILIGLMLFAGCLYNDKPLPQEVPEDFSLNYSTGAMHVEWGWYNLRINSQGNAYLNKGAVGKSLNDSFQLTEEEMLGLYQEVVSNDFFELNEEYLDPSIMDGGYSTISVTANGKHHEVRVVNTKQERFSRIETDICSVLEEKLGDWSKLPFN